MNHSLPVPSSETVSRANGQSGWNVGAQGTRMIPPGRVRYLAMFQHPSCSPGFALPDGFGHFEKTFVALNTAGDGTETGRRRFHDGAETSTGLSYLWKATAR